MKTYFGSRTNEGVCATVDDGRQMRDLAHQVRHSPTGFEWGYGGSGPADLALSLLADALGDVKKAERLYQDFKWDVVAPLSADHWMLTEAEIHGWVNQHLVV